LNVLHLYSGNLYGGVETLLLTLARCRHLCPDMEPEFALCFRGRLWDELTSVGVACHELGAVRVSRPWQIWRTRGRLARVLAERRPDVAVVHMGWTHAMFAPPIARAGVKLVHMVHSPVDRTHWLNRWARRTTPAAVIANSRFVAQGVNGWFPGVPVLPWSLPVEAKDVGDAAAVRAEVRGELRTKADAVVILQASRLEGWKGQQVHLEALGQLRDVPGWEAWFAGGPQMAGEEAFLKELRSSATALGIPERVKFLGQRTDVPRLMRAADIYCQPNSGPEPFGIAFVEALLAGLPVVTSDFGGGAEIVNESCGLLTPPSDAGAVAMTLRELIADPDRRRRLGRAGPARASVISNPARQLAVFRDALAC
jgi:glycosyltransferase involved in cell wall biosynthesis